jgi:hypothetical protein
MESGTAAPKQMVNQMAKKKREHRKYTDINFYSLGSSLRAVTMNICTVLCCLNRTSFKDVISTP